MCWAALSLAIASCRGTSSSVPESRTVAPRAQTVELKVGDPAPLFTLPGSDGKEYSLASYKGRQAVVLAWYAKAFSSA